MFTYHSMDESNFYLILNFGDKSFKTITAFALQLDITVIEVKTIQKKYNAYFPKSQYNTSTRGYFKKKEDVINCMNEFNSILIGNILKGDYDV